MTAAAVESMTLVAADVYRRRKIPGNMALTSLKKLSKLVDTTVVFEGAADLDNLCGTV